MEEFTLAEALRAAGYRTASIGKWHLGSEPFSLPEHHGFDVNIAGNAHGAPGSYFFPYQGNWLIPTTELRAKWNVLPDGKEGEYLTDRLTDEAVKFIRDKQRPAHSFSTFRTTASTLRSRPNLKSLRNTSAFRKRNAKASRSTRPWSRALTTVWAV